MPSLLQILTEPDLRQTPMQAALRGQGAADLLAQCHQFDDLHRRTGGLHHKVQALFFLHTIHRYFLPATGQQLKNQARLDGFVRDGSASSVESLCRFSEAS